MSNVRVRDCCRCPAHTGRYNGGVADRLKFVVDVSWSGCDVGPPGVVREAFVRPNDEFRREFRLPGGGSGR